jgi:hypothetical protein
MILDAFTDEINTPAYKEVSTDTFVDGKTVKGALSYVLIGNCFIYDGSSSFSAKADKLREQIDATAIFYPDADLTGVDRMKIENQIYQVISTNDIGRQGEVQMVPLGKVK